MASCAILNPISDEDLVRRCRQGEDDAFTLLYRRYMRRVLNTASRIMRNPEDARDVTQEIFLKAYLSLWRWDSGRSKLSTWLYRLTTNHAIDCWRARCRRYRVDQDSAAGRAQRDLVSGSGLAPDRELERKEQADEFRRCIEKLPELQKRFFILRHLHGFTLEEISNLEGRSLGTVKGSLHRASRSIGRSLRRAARRTENRSSPTTLRLS